MSITERRLTAVLATLLAVCVIAAASTAFLLGRREAVADRPAPTAPTASVPSSPPADDPSSVPEPPGPSSSPAATTASSADQPSATNPSASSAPPPSSAPSTSPTSEAVLDPPVAISKQAAGHPDAVAIRKLVSLNFRSINTLDYDLWVDTVTPDQPASFGPDAWNDAYRTSKDRGISIDSIDSATRWITIRFVSSQSVDKAPTDAPSTCLNWVVVRPVVTVDGQLRLAKSIPGMSKYRGCE